MKRRRLEAKYEQLCYVFIFMHNSVMNSIHVNLLQKLQPCFIKYTLTDEQLHLMMTSLSYVNQLFCLIYIVYNQETRLTSGKLPPDSRAPPVSLTVFVT